MKRPYLYRLVVLLLIGCSVHLLQAQDMHFSQFYASPLTLNPSKTGMISDYQHRLGLNYRDQWNSIESASPYTYRTFSGFFDSKVLTDLVKKGTPAAGLAFLSDQAGDGALNTTKILLSAAFHKELELFGYKNIVSGGIGLGYIQKKIDFSNFRFDNQWDEGEFRTKSLPSKEGKAGTETSYFDMHAGINWMFQLDKMTSFHAGFTMFHLNRPKDSFYGGNNRLGFRPVVTGGSHMRVTERIDLLPKAVYMRQKKAQELIFGLEGGYRLPQYGTILYLGGWYRGGDALILSTGAQYHNIRVGFSYDLNLSQLKPASELKGGPELSLIYTFGHPDRLEGPLEIPCIRM